MELTSAAVNTEEIGQKMTTADALLEHGLLKVLEE